MSYWINFYARASEQQSGWLPSKEIKHEIQCSPFSHPVRDEKQFRKIFYDSITQK